MIARFTMVAAAALLSMSVPAAAAEKAPKKEKWATKVIADKPRPVTIDPTKSYILVRSPAQIAPVLMRLPNAEQAAAHEVERQEAFARVHRSWRKRVASIELDAKVADADPSKRRKPPEPVEADFGYPSYEQKHTVFLGPQNRFSKVGGSAYLQEVPPGEYIFYAIGATCACLGTVSFDAPAGKVVALDLFALSNADGTTPFQLNAATGFADARLPADSLVPAALKPAGMRSNWFGISVDRVMPIAGVFDYERGKQVGAVAAIAAPAPEASASGSATAAP